MRVHHLFKTVRTCFGKFDLSAFILKNLFEKSPDIFFIIDNEDLAVSDKFVHMGLLVAVFVIVF